eukprot:c22044_g1_i1.p1 GENE.c22044_g1_i1~~c22044_g1_i1.p1  ORF type:complete len:764 (+),score=169.89 c22044_g1_i1:75-2294(+)
MAWNRSSNARNKPKVKIIPFDKAPATPEDWETNSWATLSAAVTAIHKQTLIGQSLNELYGLAESMVKLKMAERLYKRLHGVCDEHVRSEGLGLLAKLAEPTGFLVHVDRSWAAHCEAVKRVRNIFLVLDQTHANRPHVPGLWDLGLSMYRQHVIGLPDIGERVVQGVLELFALERRGEMVEAGLLQRLLRMLVDLRVYQDMFLARFLAATADFYRDDAARMVGELDTAGYLAHCERRLNQESTRLTSAVDDATTLSLLNGLLEEHLLAGQYKRLLAAGLDGLLDEGRHADLARLLWLLRRIKATGELRAAFVERIKRRGLALVNDTAHEDGLIEALLDLRARMDAVVTQAFGGAVDFVSGLREAMTAVVNARHDRPAELLAKYIDREMRAKKKYAGLAAEETLNAVLEASLVLFRYVSGRDVFEAFFKKDLAKRLLLGASASMDSEKALVLLLKAECGSAFTTKLEGMFRDMDVSADLAEGLEAAHPRPDPLPPAWLALRVSVLTTGNWPSYPSLAANLPADVQARLDAFEGYYLGKHSGRRLQWVPSLATCSLDAVYPNAKFKISFSLSLFQAIVLLLFNNTDTLTAAQIAEATRLDAHELERTLLSLSAFAVDKRLLIKEPKGKSVSPSDTFTWNSQFDSKLRKVKVNQIQQKETRDEAGATNARVVADRLPQVDAAIVRIMKTRQRLAHAALLAEVVGQLKFSVKSTDLKKRIESLIDREYMVRDAADPAIYIYMA